MRWIYGMVQKQGGACFFVVGASGIVDRIVVKRGQKQYFPFLFIRFHLKPFEHGKQMRWPVPCAMTL